MSGEKGLTLIETLVATLIFAIAAAAVSALMTNAFRMSDRNKERAYALSLAQSEIEDLRAARYEEVASRFGVAERGGRSFTIVRTVTRDQPSPNMAEVTVAVRWSARGGREQSYAAKTIVTAVQQ